MTKLGLTRRALIFRDFPAPELTAAELGLAARGARHAAIRAQTSLTLTKRRLYRAYRAHAGDRFLDWQRWRAFYLAEYRDTGPILAEIGINDFPGV